MTNLILFEIMLTLMSDRGSNEKSFLPVLAIFQFCWQDGDRNVLCFYMKSFSCFSCRQVQNDCDAVCHFRPPESNCHVIPLVGPPLSQSPTHPYKFPMRFVSRFRHPSESGSTLLITVIADFIAQAGSRRTGIKRIPTRRCRQHPPHMIPFILSNGIVKYS